MKRGRPQYKDIAKSETSPLADKMEDSA